MSEAKAKADVSSSTSSERDSCKRSGSSNSRASPSTSSAGSNANSSADHMHSNGGSSSSSHHHHHHHHHPQHHHQWKWGAAGNNGGAADEESIHYLSEPSLSEEGDSTTDPHLDRSLLSDDDEDTTDDNRHTPPPPPPGPPPPRASMSSAGSNGVASPGNTSLSSWESHFRPRHPNQLVRIHFSPETTSDRHHYSSSPYYHHYQPQHLFPPQNSSSEQRHQQQQQSGGENASESGSRNHQSNNNHYQIALNDTTQHSHNDMSYSTFSMSPGSSVGVKGRQKIDEFIHGLYQNNEGALKDSNVPVADDSFASFSQPPDQRKPATVDTVIRQHQEAEQSTTPPPGRRTHRRISSVETELIGNTSDAHMEEGSNPTQQQQQEHTPAIDDSPLMLNLSLLGDEDDLRPLESVGRALFETDADGSNALTPVSSGGRKDIVHPFQPAPESSPTNHTTTTDDDDHRATDSDQHHHSADDEQTAIRPPRRRTFNVAGGKPSPAHRRTRSGDSAAAALATKGAMDWIGMFKDKIPMPDGDDDDDDDTDNDNNKHRKDGGLGNGKEAKLEQGQENRDGKKKTQSFPSNGSNEKAVFSVGASEGRAAARKQRREQRQQQRTMAEKAAAVATQKRIQKQYQEWSQSPLWNMQQYHSEGQLPSLQMDSSETSLGSVPSTVGPPRILSNRAAGDDRLLHRPRNSMDTLSSGISLSSAGGRGKSRNRRNSVESRDSFFSWISASNTEAGADEQQLSPSPLSQRRILRVDPKWSPATPVMYLRKRESQRQLRHQRSQTSVGGYPMDEIHLSNNSQQQDSFRAMFLQQQQQQQQQQRTAPDYSVDEIHNASNSQRQDSFRTMLLQQQQTAADNHSFRRFPVTSPHSDVSFNTVPPAFPALPLTMPVSNKEHFTYAQHRGSSTSASSRSSSTGSSSSDGEDDDHVSVMENRVAQMHPGNITGLEALNQAEKLAEAELLKRGSNNHVLRGGQAKHSPFANFGRKSGQVQSDKKFNRASFLPKTSLLDDPTQPTYRCPRCQTIQREFFTVNNAPRQYETASGFLALSFVVYVIASLYIFGLEEGWPALDCIYFAVITLTTAGLGDFVPTSDFNKIICSIFIYFGVACIGLLLGSYIAAMLDETSRRQERENRIAACPNCARLQNIKDAAERRQMAELAASIRGDTLPIRKQSSARMSFSNPGAPFSFSFSDRLELSSDEDMQSGGNKKMKRRHDSSNKPDAFSAVSPLIAEGIGTNGLSPTKTARATETSPFTTCSKSSASTAAPIMEKIPEETTGEPDETENQKSKASQSDNQKAKPPCHHKKSKALPPLGVITSFEGGKGMAPSSRTPSTPTTPRRTQATPRQADLLGSPMTKQILGRQSHTRHASFDLNGTFSIGSLNDTMGSRRPPSSRKFGHDAPKPSLTPTISENVPFVPGTSETVSHLETGAGLDHDHALYSDDVSTDESSVVSSASYSSEETDVLSVTKVRVKTAKYVFLTLKQALVNSMVIIAVGCLGFWFIEGFTLVDSWYFTTVLLTTVGYGDIVPITKGGKLFATIYILVAGTILLNNMSLISMIPLELRKRRIERAVLTQFGDLLDDDALRELASGPLIHRLHLATHRPDGLNECTREMFALAMLVRLGKVTEDDILQTFGAFNRLDVNRDGVLNSKSIIAGMIQKSKKCNMGGMKRINSASSLLKAPHAPGVSRDSSFSSSITPTSNGGINFFTRSPATGYQQSPNTLYESIPGSTPVDTTTSETSSLLQNGQGYSSIGMLSRSH